MAAAILGYLEEHPHGMDTLEGIAEWWIARQQIRVHVATITRAPGRPVGKCILRGASVVQGTEAALAGAGAPRPAVDPPRLAQ